LGFDIFFFKLGQKELFMTKKARVIAALFCILYILFQVFQEYVFRTIPIPQTLEEELVQGAMPLHILRSTLLLLSFFFLIYVYLVIILREFSNNVLLFTLAFLGLFIFCCLEIGIRSVELFYTQLSLPRLFAETDEEAFRKVILNNFTFFQSVQVALYFPLMLSQASASVILTFAFSSRPRINMLIISAFGLNAFRLVGRLLGMTFHVTWFDIFSAELYLPLVAIIFGLIVFWLLKVRDAVTT
jgi:hypothetical protein